MEFGLHGGRDDELIGAGLGEIPKIFWRGLILFIPFQRTYCTMTEIDEEILTMGSDKDKDIFPLD